MLRMPIAIAYACSGLQLLPQFRCFDTRERRNFIFLSESGNDKIEVHDLSLGDALLEAAGLVDRGFGGYLNQHQHRWSVSDAS